MVDSIADRMLQIRGDFALQWRQKHGDLVGCAQAWADEETRVIAECRQEQLEAQDGKA